MCAYTKYLIFDDPELPPKKRVLLNTALVDSTSSMREYTRCLKVAGKRKKERTLRVSQEYRVRLENESNHSWAGLYLTIN